MQKTHAPSGVKTPSLTARCTAGMNPRPSTGEESIAAQDK